MRTEAMAYTIVTTDGEDYVDSLREAHKTLRAMAEHMNYGGVRIHGTNVVAYCGQKRCAGHLLARLFETEA
ncbi:hypothetical protein P755_gp116 [Mycobacterium phage Quink]|uniref:hypothetical protein n=1 Tax=Mycobacterium phage Contagion TaxID=1340833 RepID=UPI000218E985|nr:hypothetical protein PBI_CONTAGION_137 [Mycobacterium phage Contagion]YP_008531221.1 hypothetical protein P755_gp116 [Mycobacterium phage Quink]YP_008857630.1 hypothetical protein PHATBACTER_145 [Mycobacterium phage PhatBacter]YP_008858421.1 hypothetical protein NALA_143 [Mycobacterium phage Nala]YP_008859573.1 hypothetical protein BRUIN_138 [Mycobacterium phage Bruin]AEJ92645.1 hypothetical protein SEA_RAKIM_143 [Mycobacterium phage Rakim]AHB32088.1 hypothetical protein PBI_MOSBY_138 [Myc